MHEMSIVMGIVNAALSCAKERHAKQVYAVSVEVGELAGVEDFYLRKYFETAAKGTMLETSELRIDPAAAEAECGICGAHYHPDREHDYLCPACGSGQCRITKGRGVMVRRVEMEVEDEQSGDCGSEVGCAAGE